MEVITMESKAYQELMLKLNQLIGCMQSLIQTKESRAQEKDAWLDSKEVCELLNISLRTLYRLKQDRQIRYTMLRGRCRFKRSDAEQLLQGRVVATHPHTLDELHQGYTFK